MLKIDIISGFLGAGKTTFIERLLKTNIKNEKVVLIENEFGEVSVDSDVLRDTNIDIKELSQGCICCSLVGDFSNSLNEVIEKFNPNRIIIEPSGVGKLTDVKKAIIDAGLENYINSLICLVDVSKAKVYARNFGEFFIDQIKNAYTVVLSRCDVQSLEKKNKAIEVVRSHNKNCVIVTTPINELSDEELLKAYEGFDIDLLKELKEELEHHHHEEECCCGHHHEHHHHEEECCCGHHHEHHHHEEECCCGGHHEHHHHEEECCCGGHEHHHHEEECCCGHHHEHHHADEVFTSVGIETPKKFDINSLTEMLNDMSEGCYGLIVRAKGIVCGTDNKWYMFNLTPNEVTVVETNSIPLGKICVIGSKIDEQEIKELF